MAKCRMKSRLSWTASKNVHAIQVLLSANAAAVHAGLHIAHALQNLFWQCSGICTLNTGKKQLLYIY